MDKSNFNYPDSRYHLGGLYDDLTDVSEIGGDSMSTAFLIIFGLWILSMIGTIAIVIWEDLL